MLRLQPTCGQFRVDFKHNGVMEYSFFFFWNNYNFCLWFTSLHMFSKRKKGKQMQILCLYLQRQLINELQMVLRF